MTKPIPELSTSSGSPSGIPVSTRMVPVSTGMVPVLLPRAVLQGKARQSSGELHPLHLAALQHLQKSAAIQASRGLSPAADLSHQGLQAFLTFLHHPWKRFQCTHRPPWSILPAPPSSLQPPGLGTGPGWVERLPWHRDRAGRGWLPLPGFLREPCALPAAPAQRQTRSKVFLAFSFPN